LKIGSLFFDNYLSRLYNFFDYKYQIIKWFFLILLYAFFIVLSFYSYPIADASLYFNETVHISETIRNLDWIGNEPVGTHGFLFKLVPALFLIFFGINPVYLTLFHIVLSFFSVLLLEKILSTFLSEKVYIFCGIILLSTTYIFIHGSLSYYREIPVLFSVILLIYALIKKKKNWIIGLILLLVFDAKEHVFFQLAPGLFFSIIYQQLIIKKNIKSFLWTNLIYFLPVFLYLAAMLYTSIIPINSFILAILPLSQKGSTWLISGFELGYMTTNERDVYATSSDNIFLLFRWFISKTYFAKPFLPRVFSFLSVHFIFVVPSFIYVVKSFKKLFFKNRYSSERKNVDDRLIPLLFIYISFIIIYFFRVSHGRYLFSLSPLIFLFFFLFIHNVSGKSKKVFVFLILYSVLALIFELNFLIIKIIMAIVILVLLYFVLYINKKNILLFSLLLMLFTGGSSILALVVLDDGFINRYIKYGKFEEADIIFNNINLDGNIYTNSNSTGNIRGLLKAKIPNYFKAHSFELKEIFPKKELINTYYNFNNVFSFYYVDDKTFLNNLREIDIETMVLYVSEDKQNSFSDQFKLEEFVNNNLDDIFFLKRQMDLKNKTVYIYDVNLNK